MSQRYREFYWAGRLPLAAVGSPIVARTFENDRHNMLDGQYHLTEEPLSQLCSGGMAGINHGRTKA